MTGYVRKDTSNNIADGNIINAADLDAEFDGVQDAFNASTGHKHDGTAGEGAPITAVGPTQDVTVSATLVAPKTTNTVDIGSSSLKFKDIYITGTATLPTVNATTVDTTNLEVTNIKAKDGTASASIADTTGVMTIASAILTTADINGGTIDGTAIGGSTAAAGSFTTLTTSSTVTHNGGTANGVAYLNGSKVLTTGSALTFDGNKLAIQSGSATANRIDLFNDVGNATLRVGYDTSNNYTITRNTADANIYLNSTQAGAAQVWQLAGTEQMRLTSTGLDVKGKLGVGYSDFSGLPTNGAAFAGSVGIGTSSPSTRLHVTTGATGAQALFSHTSGTPTIAIGNSTTTYNTQIGYNVTSEYGYIQAVAAAGVYDDIAINPLGGNLGIGTSSPGAKLAVIGTSGTLSNACIRVNSTPGTQSASSGLWLSGNQSTSHYNWLLASQYNVNATFEITPSTAVDGATFSNPVYTVSNAGLHKWFNGTTQAMTLDASGNLVVGTTSANGRLTIDSGSAALMGSFNSTNANGGYIILSTSGTVYGDIGTAFQAVGGSASDFVINARGARNLVLGTNNTERARIDSSGNLYLGATSGARGGSTTRQLVKLGTSQSYLEIQSASTSSTADAILFSDGSTGNYGQVGYNHSADALNFFTASTERARIDSSGNFNIGGTQSGAEKRLYVIGTDTGSTNYTALFYNSDSSKAFFMRNDGYAGATYWYATTTGSAANVYVDSNGGLLRSTSALKYKQDIRDLEEIDINKFRPVRYKSKCANDDQTIDHFGVIADEVDAAGIKELVSYGPDGEVEGFQYERLTVVLLKEIQSLRKRVAELEAK